MKLNGFQLGHLLTRRFYWLFWAAAKYRLTGNPSFVTNGANVIGVHGAYPNQELWEAEYRVGMMGKIFGAVILLYVPTTPPIGFLLPVPISKWKKTLKMASLSAALTLILGVSIHAQTDCPSGMVCVPQETANRLFNTVEQLIEAKTAIEKMLKERGASDAALASAMQVIEGWKSLDAINNTIIAKQKDVIALYERTIQLYAGLVETLEKRLAKPKSAWSKFLDGIKTVLTLAAGIALGRGI